MTTPTPTAAMTASTTKVAVPPPLVREIPKSILESGKLPEAVAVSVVKWKKLQKVCNDHNSESIECKDVPGRERWTVTWFPRLAVFEIYFYPAQTKFPVSRCFVPVENAQFWE